MKRVGLLLPVLCCVLSTVFLGCGKKGADTVAVGAVFPLSGPVANYGTESRDGALLAIDEINAAGGLLGKQLTLIPEDDEGNAEKSLNAFTKLTTRDKVAYILGSSTSGATMSMTQQAQANKIVLISPSATNVNVTGPGDYIFRACFIDPFQGVVGAEFSYNDLGSRRAAILYDGGADYNTDLAKSFEEHFKVLGGEIVANEAYQSGDVDFNAQVTRIKSHNPDVVYLPNYYNDVALQAKQFRDQGVTVPLVGGDGWDSLVDNAGDEALNGYWSAGFNADTTDPKGQAFVKNFQAKYNRNATQFAALGYDATMP
ncbi:MAG: ABC transporter substrate-binding protein [Spirochaetaceae bacterium]|jgi:branched-chain amino acid transport system substrate-binding protein|nr:ABC transporter substrate-binding protein [Spirochaetaceae bacterium]